VTLGAGAVGIVTDYGLDSQGVGVRVPEGQDFSPLHVVHTGSGAHLASFLDGKAAECANLAPLITVVVGYFHEFTPQKHFGPLS
jgi:hypothetical protein